MLLKKQTFSFLLIAALLLCAPSFMAQTNLDSASFISAYNHPGFGQNNLVVIAEVHVAQNTFETEYFIVNKLAEKGYKTIFIESGTSEALILNEFLSTGDTSLLKYTRAAESSGTYRKFVTSLFRLNKEKNYGLIFKGFDFERAEPVVYLFSKWFTGSTIADKNFQEQIQLLLSIQKYMKTDMYGTTNLNEVFSKARKNFQKNEPYYRELLGNDLGNFKNILFNNVVASGLHRDEQMKDAIIKKVTDLNRSIIIVGKHHVTDGKNLFIPLLAKDLPEQYSMNCFVMIYKNCLLINRLEKYKNHEYLEKYSSDKKYLKYLNKEQSTDPLIDFHLLNESIIPTERKNVYTIVTGLYNQ
jgi:hypothetical protein